MGDGYRIFLIVLACVFGWLLYNQIRTRPGLFTAEALQNASFTMALLAIFLMAVVGFFMITMS